MVWRYIVALTIKIKYCYFTIPVLIDSGSDINMLNINRIPAKYWTVTSKRLHTIGADPLVNVEVPKANVFLNQYRLDVRFMLIKLNQVY